MLNDNDTLRSRVTKRACDLLGGPAALADRLGVSQILIRVWLAGTEPAPNQFFSILEVIQESDPTYRMLIDRAAEDYGRRSSSE